MKNLAVSLNSLSFSPLFCESFLYVVICFDSINISFSLTLEINSPSVLLICSVRFLCTPCPPQVGTISSVMKLVITIPDNFFFLLYALSRRSSMLSLGRNVWFEDSGGGVGVGLNILCPVNAIKPLSPHYLSKNFIKSNLLLVQNFFML